MTEQALGEKIITILSHITLDWIFVLILVWGLSLFYRKYFMKRNVDSIDLMEAYVRLQLMRKYRL